LSGNDALTGRQVCQYVIRDDRANRNPGCLTELLRQAKRKAAEEGRTLASLIGRAQWTY